MSPPYPQRNAIIGLTPTRNVDIPLSTIFMLLFLLAAIIHMTLLQINFRRGQKFLMSGMAFGFSFSRVITCILRIVWASYPTNIKIALAAQVFVAAGTILLFLINIIFTSRLLRAYHAWAWNPWIRNTFRAAYVSLFVGLIANISVLVENFFTLDAHVWWIDRVVTLVVSTYFAVYAFMPIPLLALRLLLPRGKRVEKFGTGSFRTKIRVVLFVSVLLTLGAAFRAGTAYRPRGIDDPAWYHSKACFIF
ncbi:22cade39-10bb-4fd0-bdd9-eceb98af57d5 [Sclerotinia trifoliorum]|uniref:22cade39-10bb-4fd0-bdd9-eceb98af57d5 n=1 Tax=Sclerotinia trifoliorum TaxID=28548 RepID=A0A8H2VUU0_9HELO|nr:22cade39-10bb-4fd0-bdd9-eceb98af57d5 [Sclerotinia trifoliorum]